MLGFVSLDLFAASAIISPCQSGIPPATPHLYPPSALLEKSISANKKDETANPLLHPTYFMAVFFYVYNTSFSFI